MIERPRLPAVITLIIVLIAGVLFLGLTRHNSAADAAELAELQRAIAEPNAKPAAWMKYGAKLQQLGQYPQAIIAYQHILESDAYNRAVRLNCACCLALLGNADDLLAFLRATLLVDPKLTVNLLGRPEVAVFRSEKWFPTLQQEAIAQSMD